VKKRANAVEKTAVASEQTNKAKIKISWRLREAWLEAPGASLSHIRRPSYQLKLKTESRIIMANIFSVLIGALHDSRRRQAVQIIRSYPHLAHEDAGIEIFEKIPEPSRLYTSLARGEFIGWKGLGAKSLVTALVLGFGILHVIGGTLIDHARASHAGPSAAVTTQGD
jgi:hypothetical protein